MTTIDYSFMLGLYGGSSTSTSTAAAAVKKQPTAPWALDQKTPEASLLVRTALASKTLIDERAQKLDLKSASPDYKKMFALYGALESLNALADRADTKNLGSLELSRLVKRFDTGLAEVAQWLPQAGFEDVRLALGQVKTTSKSTVSVAKDSAMMVTGAIHEGAATDVNPAFEGDLAFNIAVTKSGATQNIAINLNEMGAAPRSLTNVMSFINGKLTDAGVQTTFTAQQVPATPKSIKQGDKTVTLPAGPDRWALALRGVSSETVSFSSVATSDAVYVVQSAGTAGQHQVLKFQGEGTAPEAMSRPGEAFGVEGRSSQTALPEGVAAVRASATGPDGSLWLVADMDGAANGQAVKGESDVALLKLDSTGRIISTQMLGAADKANGYAIAVGADGRVAVAGSVTGALEPGKAVTDTATADSFVTVFSADGEELWTQRRGARAADEATSVQFGDDGKIYVAGRARSGMPGAPGLGGWDGYVQSFSEFKAHDLAAPVALASGVSQFGTAGDDSVDAMAVDGSNLYTAGIENNRLIIRQFTLDASGQPTLAATRDLGAASGEVAGISVSGGKVMVSGTTMNGALDAGTVTTAHHGGKDAFVAVLSGDLAASADDRLTYIGGEGDDTAADVKVVDGKVWVTGVANRPIGAKDTDPVNAYLTRIDPLTGAVEMRRDWTGQDVKATPQTLAVARNGASALDRLGLPQGIVDQSQSKTLVNASGLRVGDRFYVQSPETGRQVPVTITAKDTLQTLATKIEQASGRKLKVTITSNDAVAAKQGEVGYAVSAGSQTLTIKAASGRDGAVLIAGEPGRNALAGLGLTAGAITPLAADAKKDAVKSFGLDLPSTLDISTADGVKKAMEQLFSAMKAVRSAYNALNPANKTASTGAAPAYITAQISNYQNALARLGG